MAEYNTIQRPGSGEYEEKRSRFIGAAIPVSSQEEIREHLEKVRKTYYDARHHCYAYVLGEKKDVRKASDDGEPSGTAGLPILKVIDGSGCTNVLIIVTRYFGGTLLGTGGLVRAYTQAAKLALQDAGIVTLKEGEILELVMEYSCLDRISYLLKQEKIVVTDTEYTDKVVMRLKVPSMRAAEIREKILQSGAGTIGMTTLERGYFGFDFDNSQS